jgi:hypothetical protein
MALLCAPSVTGTLFQAYVPVAQLAAGNGLKIRTVWVRVPPGALRPGVHAGSAEIHSRADKTIGPRTSPGRGAGLGRRRTQRRRARKSRTSRWWANPIRSSSRRCRNVRPGPTGRSSSSSTNGRTSATSTRPASRLTVAGSAPGTSRTAPRRSRPEHDQACGRSSPRRGDHRERAECRKRPCLARYPRPAAADARFHSRQESGSSRQESEAE